MIRRWLNRFRKPDKVKTSVWEDSFGTTLTVKNYYRGDKLTKREEITTFV